MSCEIEVKELLEKWLDKPKAASWVINFLVEFLTQDEYWLNENILNEDRKILIKLGETLTQQCEKCAGANHG